MDNKSVCRRQTTEIQKSSARKCSQFYKEFYNENNGFFNGSGNSLFGSYHNTGMSFVKIFRKDVSYDGTMNIKIFNFGIFLTD